VKKWRKHAMENGENAMKMPFISIYTIGTGF
jgi:hypothetical protein